MVWIYVYSVPTICGSPLQQLIGLYRRGGGSSVQDQVPREHIGYEGGYGQLCAIQRLSLFSK
jgi:hypothetical protein